MIRLCTGCAKSGPGPSGSQGVRARTTSEKPVPSDCQEVRKATLASVLAKATAGLRLNDHLEHEDGAVEFRHACKMGLEGIVSKRKDSSYRSGRSKYWLKFKNPNAPAVKREAEEDWI